MPPVIFHVDSYHTQYTHYNTPINFIIHNTQSYYMEWYGWLMEIYFLVRICDTSHLKNQIPISDRHDIQFIIALS